MGGGSLQRIKEHQILRGGGELSQNTLQVPCLLIAKACKKCDEGQALSLQSPRVWTPGRVRAGCQREAGAWEWQGQTYISCQSLLSLFSVWFIRSKTKKNRDSRWARQPCGRMRANNGGWPSSHPTHFHLRVSVVALNKGCYRQHTPQGHYSIHHWSWRPASRRSW